ncbi:hypothetical protein ACVOMV_25955 (plasmid) [Mesorhizobium atlanticum]|uniref:hypothetical protein n=1 Tax=Mesorhizobium atlanticum TaxID=2233532 RepID=UPI003703CD93
MVLDPDGQVDVFTFSGGRGNAHYVGTVTPEDSDNYIVRNVVGRVPGWGDGTTYSYVLEKALRHLGWLPQEQGASSAGFRKADRARGGAEEALDNHLRHRWRE